MSLRPLHGALAGIGAWMVSACLSALENLYPAKFAPHPQVIIAFGIIGAGLLLASLLLWLGDKRKAQLAPQNQLPLDKPSQLQGSGNQVGGDNSGKLIGNIEHYHEAAKEPEKPKSQVSAPTLVEPKFDVSWRMAYIVYEASPGCWKECPADYKEAKLALIFDVFREVPPPKQNSKHSVSVLAILKFITVGSESIPRAYWLHLQDYRAGFIVGHKESLVIATYEEPYLATYTNPRYGELMEDQFPVVPYREKGPRTIMPAIPFTIELSLWDWYANSTIQQNQFGADVQEGRFLVTWHS